MTTPDLRRTPEPPRLDVIHHGAGGGDLVVLAHGGQETSLEAAHDRRPSLLRMWPFVAAAHAGAPGTAVALLRYRYRGWNGPQAHPVADLRTVLGGLPSETRRVVLVGHSMGGRAVLRCADDPRVRGVLALAPWLPADEPAPDLRGRLVVTAHGTQDELTDPRGTAAFVARLRGAGTPAAELSVAGEAHALLRRHRDWDVLVRRFVAACIGGDGPDPFLADAVSDDAARRSVALPRWGRSGGRYGAILSIARARVVSEHVRRRNGGGHQPEQQPGREQRAAMDGQDPGDGR